MGRREGERRRIRLFFFFISGGSTAEVLNPTSPSKRDDIQSPEKYSQAMLQPTNFPHKRTHQLVRLFRI